MEPYVTNCTDDWTHTGFDLETTIKYSLAVRLVFKNLVQFHNPIYKRNSCVSLSGFFSVTTKLTLTKLCMEALCIYGVVLR